LYQEVVEYSEQLEEKVKERTEELSDLQEQQRQMMLDISHQLQTPLTIIKGELQILREGMSDTAAIDVCEHSVDNVSKMINDLLRLARLESVSVDRTAYKPISISRTVDEIGEYFETTVHADTQVSFSSFIAKDIMAAIDKDDLVDIVSNVLNNAVRYTDPKRKNNISLTLKKRGEKATIIIADTGLGVEKENLSHIFERFYRSPHARKYVKEGTGLGLAIVRKLVEHYDGTIEVESKLGKETTFTITFEIT